MTPLVRFLFVNLAGGLAIGLAAGVIGTGPALSGYE